MGKIVFGCIAVVAAMLLFIACNNSPNAEERAKIHNARIDSTRMADSINAVAAVKTVIQKRKAQKDLQKSNLKGKVKTITESDFSQIGTISNIENAKFSDKMCSKKEILTFDANGNLTEHDYFIIQDTFSDGRHYEQKLMLLQKEIYKYDNSQNKIEYQYWVGGKLQDRNTFKYDSKGNQIKCMYYTHNFGGDTVSIEQTMKYDENGNNIEVDPTNYSGDACKEFHKYNEVGLLIEDDAQRAGDVHSFIDRTYRYDEKGNLVEEDWFVPSGSQDNKITYKYDDNGNRKETDNYTQTVNGNFYLQSILRCAYDTSGNQTIESHDYLKANGYGNSTNDYKFMFDNFGNWIRKLKYVNMNERATELWQREIKYY